MHTKGIAIGYAWSSAQQNKRSGVGALIILLLFCFVLLGAWKGWEAGAPTWRERRVREINIQSSTFFGGVFKKGKRFISFSISKNIHIVSYLKLDLVN